MTTKRVEPSEETLRSIRMYRERLQEIEESWAFARDAARKNLLKAITEEGISVAKAAELSGHDRRVIKNWLDIHNALQKAQQKAK